MAKTKARVLAYCPSYNGYQALFMMDADDFRVVTDEAAFKFGYEVLDVAPVYNHKFKTLTTKHGAFSVAYDGSLLATQPQSKALVASLLKAAA